MPKAIDLTGQQFTRLKVISFGEHRRSISGTSKRYWVCQCECGNKCMVSTHSLVQRYTKSCGCLKIESDKNGCKSVTHGKSKTRLYKIWIDMKRRCDDEWRKAYKYYGDRGITYCKEWKTFEPFYEWAMNNGYKDNLTLDRINNDGDYEPDNCRWVDYFVQANNRSNNHFITYKGRTQTISQWAGEIGLSQSVIRDRLNKLNWSIEKTFETPYLGKQGEKDGK